MANTFIKIASITVGSGGNSSLDFSNIPQDYSDLKIIVSLRSSVNNSNSWVKFNGTSTGYTGKQVYGTGAIVASNSLTNASLGPLTNDSGFTANIFSNAEVYLPNYSSTSYNKTYHIISVTENLGQTAYQNMMAGLWSNTSAITSLSIVSDNGPFVQYSTATLYGIKSS